MVKTQIELSSQSLSLSVTELVTDSLTEFDLISE